VTVHLRFESARPNSAGHLLDRVPGYLDLLDRHGVAFSERRSTDPGPILYEDAVQILVVPEPRPRSR
jgi:hypothetical protein